MGIYRDSRRLSRSKPGIGSGRGEDRAVVAKLLITTHIYLPIHLHYFVISFVRTVLDLH
jgi:hypothetical protein